MDPAPPPSPVPAPHSAPRSAPHSAPLVTTTLLLQRLHNSRDAEAWEQFDARFRGIVVSTAMRVGLNRQDAEEAAQETMLCALRDYQAGKYDRSRGRLSSWIVGIAHHRIVDVQRSRRRGSGTIGVLTSDVQTPGSLPAAAAGPREPDVAVAFELSLERHIFERAWERLKEDGGMSEPTLAAFELTAMRGVPASAAAAQCGMSADQVYVAKHRVAKKLQEIVAMIDRAVRDGL